MHGPLNVIFGNIRMGAHGIDGVEEENFSFENLKELKIWETE
jgi:hypothetical protein